MTMTRLEAVRFIMQSIENELVVVTTGFLSRDVFMIKDRPQNFYMCGSMGNAFPIGLGIAMNTNKKVVVISGDGAVLMGLSSLVVGEHLHLQNIEHYIIDDNKYGSTGGQKTCSRDIDFTQFAKTKVVPIIGNDPPSPRITLAPELILQRFMEAIKA